MSIISAIREFAMAAQILSTVMVPNVPREERRKALNTILGELSEDTFKRGVIADRILKMNMIDMGEEISKQHEDTESQVEGILSWLPRMKLHRDRLKDKVKRHRKKYGLKV